MTHSVVCSIDVPIVRHIGLVCACGEVFALDIGDFDTFNRQAALMREHMTDATVPQKVTPIIGSDIKQAIPQ